MKKLMMALVFAMSASSAYAVDLACQSPTEAMAQYNQTVAAEQARLNQRYADSMASMQAKKDLAAAVRDARRSGPFSSPDQAAEEINQIETDYMNTCAEADMTYTAETRAAADEYNANVAAAQAAYDRATCRTSN